MTTSDILTDLRVRGVVLTAERDRLRYDGPAGTMTPQVVTMLKAHKRELLAMLGGTPLYFTRDGAPVHQGPNVWQGRDYWVDAGGDWWERTATGGLALRWRRRRAARSVNDPELPKAQPESEIVRPNR